MTIIRFTTVLFDLDDTLLDSFRARDDTLKQVFAAHGVILNPGWHLADHRGSEIRDIFRRSGVTEALLDDCFTDYRRRYWTREHAPLALYPGVRELLEKLQDHGVKIGLVTQKSRDFLFEGCRAGAKVELEKMGIAALFDVIVGFEDVTNTKPDPEGITLALTKLGSRAEMALYVGDSLADMRAARSAGCRCCHAHWAVSRLEGFQPDYTAASPEELAKIVFP